jgi:hypothetical protein
MGGLRVALLDSAWLKINRAREHVEAVQDAVDDWLATDAYSMSREVDPETSNTVRRAQVRADPPERLSLLIGDAVHNLRAALDHAVYALAQSQLGTLAPDVEETLMFPIVGNQNRKGQPIDGSDIFDNAVGRGLLQGVPTAAIAFIKREQPYQWNSGFEFHELWTLHELDRIDKHRRVALTTAFLDFQFVSVPKDVEPRVTFTRAEGPVKDGDILVTYSGGDMGVDAHFTRDVSVNEGVMAGYSINRLLTPVQQKVAWIVATLPQYL